MVRIRNLHFGYSRKRPLFQNLDLTLERGHIYGLLGKNGAGKSTLLKNIVGLAFPDAGTCEVLGQPAARRLPAVLADVFFLSEEVYVPTVTAAQFVEHTAGFYPRFDHAALAHYLSDFEVPAQAVLSALSFGQQKRLALAIALALRPGTLILDEPYAGFDWETYQRFWSLAAERRARGCSVLVVSHLAYDRTSFDRLLEIRDGSLHAAERAS